jgi:hypothetical protein
MRISRFCSRTVPNQGLWAACRPSESTSFLIYSVSHILASWMATSIDVLLFTIQYCNSKISIQDNSESPLNKMWINKENILLLRCVIFTYYNAWINVAYFRVVRKILQAVNYFGIWTNMDFDLPSYKTFEIYLFVTQYFTNLPLSLFVTILTMSIHMVFCVKKGSTGANKRFWTCLMHDGNMCP